MMLVSRSSSCSRRRRYFNHGHSPDILGPLWVPPTIGMTIRSCPVGTGPSENRSPNSTSMLYRRVIVGGTGEFCAIVLLWLRIDEENETIYIGMRDPGAALGCS